jgi:acetyl-CoA carboxylase / biotin carboxylase 1
VRCQGVWAGWGHASENPKLPDSLRQTKAQIAFLGPPGSSMRALGDKISSTIVAQSADVPCMPWSGSGLTVPCPPAGSGSERQVIADVPQDIYDKACITDGEVHHRPLARALLPRSYRNGVPGGGGGRVAWPRPHE